MKTKCQERVEKRLQHKFRIIEALEKGSKWYDALEIASCGDKFRVGECRKCGLQVAYPIRCGNRLCPDCQNIRVRKFIREHYEILRKLRYPKMLTLTFPSVEKIDKKYIKWARKCFEKLRHRKVMENCWGGVYSFEMTHSELFGWHLHIHALIGASYIPQDELSREWKKISGAYIVDIRAVKKYFNGKNFTKWHAIKEVLKYPTKVLSFIDNEELVSEFLEVTERVNLAYGFGAMYHATVKDEEGYACPWCGSEDINWSCSFEVKKDDIREYQGKYVYIPP